MKLEDIMFYALAVIFTAMGLTAIVYLASSMDAEQGVGQICLNSFLILVILKELMRCWK